MDRNISFDERSKIEALFMPFVVEYLLEQPETIEVQPADEYQQRIQDIDLLWKRAYRGEANWKTIEVKVDTQAHKTGNFVFETISNKQAKTIGCFLKSEADYLYYLFAGAGVLWRMPFGVARDWFLREIKANPERFRIVEPSTPASNGRKGYTSEAYLIPVSALRRGLEHDLRQAIIEVPPLP